MMARTMTIRCAGLLALLAALALSGCSTAPIVEGDAPETAVFDQERLVMTDVDTPFIVNDPWEGLNRTIYRFNYHVDRWVLIPAVNTYRFLLPQPLRTGVRNFMNNLFGIRTLANQLLQGRPVRAVQTTGRLAVNTTLGIAGLFDVATHAGMPFHREDFGQTLGVWGVKPGPYLVLPLFGPSNLRDGVGLAVDSAFQSWVDPLNFDDHPSRQYIYYPLLILDTRDRVAFRYHSTGSPFEYELVRRLILTVREIEVAK